MLLHRVARADVIDRSKTVTFSICCQFTCIERSAAIGPFFATAALPVLALGEFCPQNAAIVPNDRG